MAPIPLKSELTCMFLDEIDCIQMLLDVEVLKMLRPCTICGSPIVFCRILWSCNSSSC